MQSQAFSRLLLNKIKAMSASVNVFVYICIKYAQFECIVHDIESIVQTLAIVIATSLNESNNEM